MTNQELIKIDDNTKVNQINIHQLLKQNEAQILRALPKHLNADRLLRIAMTEISKTPALKDCTAKSLLGAIIQCSQLGLEPGNSLGHAYLIPYDLNKNVGTRANPQWKKEKVCQFMIGYKGMIDLARRSGELKDISARSVYSNDDFELEYGLDEKLMHKIPINQKRGEFIGAYLVANFKNGGHHIEFMNKYEIDSIRERSKCAKNGPWVTDYEQMAKKTVIRRSFNQGNLPVSIEIANLIEQDYKADNGEQINDFVIDGECEAVKYEQKSTNKADRIANKFAEEQEQTTSEEEPRNVAEAAAEFFGEDH